MRATLYGIPNCDQVKKARAWLAENQCDVDFHDFKKMGIDRTEVRQWLHAVDLEILLNRKGTTWRGLTDERKAAIVDADTAMTLMLELPSIIKRPVLVLPDGFSKITVGFSADVYQSLFKKSS